jgi:putative transposase
VSVSCRVLGFSKQAYYRWVAEPVSNRDFDDAHALNAALDVHRNDPTFGHLFLRDELELIDIELSRNRMHRLCRMQRIWSIHSKKRGLNRKAGPPVHDLVDRDFSASGPNVKWLTDIAEHPTSEGKLYLNYTPDPGVLREDSEIG